MASELDLRRYLGTLAAILWNYGAEFPVPTLDPYDSGELGFELNAEMPGAAAPKPAVIRLLEVWTPTSAASFQRVEYAYDFVEYPLGRRRAFHRHDEDHFVREFGVTVHEHCEEQLDRPVCGHYYGLPVDGYEAIERFTHLWGQPRLLGCAELRCMG